MMDELIERARAMWGLGAYKYIALQIQPAAHALVEACAITEGQRVLDVGAGTGNVALEAARLGARVTATDLSPTMVEKGAARSAEAGFEIEWSEANVEDLPFPNGSFDVVASCFGAIFAPHHDRMAQEITRVASGGVVGITAWAQGGLNAETMAVMAEHMPPPPEGAGTPPQWGDEEYVRERFDDLVAHLLIERRAVRWSFESMEEARRLREEYAAPFIAFRSAVGDAVAREVGDRTDEILGRHNLATDATVLYDADYLLIVARAR